MQQHETQMTEIATLRSQLSEAPIDDTEAARILLELDALAASSQASIAGDAAMQKRFVERMHQAWHSIQLWTRGPQAVRLANALKASVRIRRPVHDELDAMRAKLVPIDPTGLILNEVNNLAAIFEAQHSDAEERGLYERLERLRELFTQWDSNRGGLPS